MGQTIKKIKIHDTLYSDYFKNEIGKSLTTVDASVQDTTIVKESTDTQQLKINFGTITMNSDSSRTEKITVSAVPGSNFTSPDQFLSAVSTQISGTFTTHDIETTMPYRSQTNNDAEFYYSLRSKYNYYAGGYENTISELSERILPNYYIQKSNLTDQKSNFENPDKSFFKNIGTIQSLDLPRTNLDKCRNVFISNLNSVESTADKYPMYNEIKFVSSVVGKMAQFLNQQGLMPFLISDFTNANNLGNRNFDLLISDKNANVTNAQSISVFNLISWVQNQNFSIDETNITFVDSVEKGSFYSDRIKKHILNGILRYYTKEHLRTYEQIVNSEPCHIETLMYKVEKYVGNVIGDPVQTFWISNERELNIILDTQIKYGTSYSYDVKQVVMVVGNSYSFSRPILDPDDRVFKAYIDITNTPSIQVLEIPYFTDKVVAIQSPPLRPHVDFSTKMDSEQKIKISLSHNLGEQIESFTSVETSDLQQLDAMNLFAPNYTAPTGEYYFYSDGTPQYYEVFRLDTKPNSYEDFSENKLMDAKSFFDETRDSSSHVSVNDFVLPNKKYYYMFRSVNVHNHVSNPTVVYEVELIQDADDSKVVFKKFDFESPPIYQSSKKFGSLFQIMPALQQRILDNDQPSLYNKATAKNSLNDIKLGNAADSVWGKTFKIRITSTTTGRKIDFNIKFNTITSKTEEDFE